MSRPVSAAAQNQAAVVLPEGQAVFPLVQIHAPKRRRVFQRQHVGALLVELQKIAAVLVQEGKMGGDDKSVRPDDAPVCDGCALFQPPHGGIFIDGQLVGNGRQKFQRMKLRLMGKFHRPHRGKGQRQIFGKLRLCADAFQRLHLLLQLFPVIGGIDIVVLLGKITVDPGAEGAKRGNCLLVGLQIQRCLFRSKAFGQLLVDQAMLGGYFSGGVLRDAPGDGSRFRHGAVHPRVLQHTGAEQPRHPAADDQNIRPRLSPQRRKTGHPQIIRPDRPHEINSFSLSIGKKEEVISPSCDNWGKKRRGSPLPRRFAVQSCRTM